MHNATQALIKIDEMGIKDMLLIILPVLSAYLTYLFSLRSRKVETIQRFKEEKYANLIILLQGFIGVTASGETKKSFLRNRINPGYTLLTK